MAQFQVPQFIETEDKIVGPLTLKQFLYLAGAGFTSFMLFFVLQLWLWFIVTMFLAAIAASFAFIKVNGRPFAAFLNSVLKYAWYPRLYIWQSSPKLKEKKFETLEIPKIKKESLFKKLVLKTQTILPFKFKEEKEAQKREYQKQLSAIQKRRVDFRYTKSNTSHG